MRAEVWIRAEILTRYNMTICGGSPAHLAVNRIGREGEVKASFPATPMANLDRYWTNQTRAICMICHLERHERHRRFPLKTFKTTNRDDRRGLSGDDEENCNKKEQSDPNDQSDYGRPSHALTA